MKKAAGLMLLIFLMGLLPPVSVAQCSVCTRNTEQLGEAPAGKMNMGVLYLAAAPLAIIGVIGYRWFRRNRA